MPRPSTNPRNANIRLSMDPATKARLQEYAVQRHTSVSQLVTDWIWSVSVNEDAGTGAETEKK